MAVELHRSDMFLADVSQDLVNEAATLLDWKRDH
jgi:hypothetical protein